MYMLYINHIYVICICNECLHVHVMYAYKWTVDLTIILIIPSSSLHLLIFSDRCVSMDALLFIWLQGMVIQILFASF